MGNDAIGVVGFDVAGDEGSYPLRSFDDTMAEAVQRYISKL